uniref:RHS repeat-associated core domain-containing protein n=1 Tax=Pseudomonas rhizoryzae TaxID=2571129 RepID=UPI0018756E25
PQELTDASGTLAWSARYRAYGNLARLDVEQIAQPLRFQGQYHDPETGLHYNRHRYYHPETGSFITPDPIRLAGGLNSYRYAPNPTGWVDPLGLANVRGQCPGLDSGKREDKYYDSRREAFRKAKQDAGIPVTAPPLKIGRVELERAGETVYENHRPVLTREYHYQNIHGENVVIQEHSRGHIEFPAETAAGQPHFNVREYNPATGNGYRTKTLKLEAIAKHYVFK